MKLLTPTQVAEQLSISRSLVYQIVKSGDLPCHRIGKGRGSIRVSEADLREYIRNTRIAHGERSRKSTARPRLKHLRI